MIIDVQLRNSGSHRHRCAHFDVKDNGVLEVYSAWEPHEFGVRCTLDTAYSRDFWQCVTIVKERTP